MTGRLLERQMSDSFLVRCWIEPREVADQPEVLRVYVRNLKSGEEHYLNEPGQIGQVIERGLRHVAGVAAESADSPKFEVG